MGLRGGIDGCCAQRINGQRRPGQRRGASTVAGVCVPGVVRLPMNLIEGVRSACCAACRRTLVANIVYAGRCFRLRDGVVVCWSSQVARLHAQGFSVSPRDDCCPSLEVEAQWQGWCLVTRAASRTGLEGGELSAGGGRQREKKEAGRRRMRWSLGGGFHRRKPWKAPVRHMHGSANQRAGSCWPVRSWPDGRSRQRAPSTSNHPDHAITSHSLPGSRHPTLAPVSSRDRATMRRPRSEERKSRSVAARLPCVHRRSSTFPVGFRTTNGLPGFSGTAVHMLLLDPRPKRAAPADPPLSIPAAQHVSPPPRRPIGAIFAIHEVMLISNAFAATTHWHVVFNPRHPIHGIFPRRIVRPVSRECLVSPHRLNLFVIDG